MWIINKYYNYRTRRELNKLSSGQKITAIFSLRRLLEKSKKEASKTKYELANQKLRLKKITTQLLYITEHAYSKSSRTNTRR